MGLSFLFMIISHLSGRNVNISNEFLNNVGVVEFTHEDGPDL